MVILEAVKKINQELLPYYGQGLTLGATPRRTPGLKTGIGLGHYQQEISDRESTIMPYIGNFDLWPD
jgi:hypothetical protein